MLKVKFKVGREWSHRKIYWTLVQNNEKKQFYNAPYGGLELEHDPDTGRVTPTNAIQETKQVLNKKLVADMRKFRAEFKKFAKNYWELLEPTELQNQPNWGPSTTIPANLKKILNKEEMVEFLKHIKKNAWKRTGWSAGSSNKMIVTDLDYLLDLWLRRLTRTVYHLNEDKHTKVPVPLGTPCAEHPYQKYKA